MKKLSKFTIACLSMAVLFFSGCVKTSDTNTTNSTLPNINGFSIVKAGSVIAGYASTIQVAGLLTNGTYTINYSLGAPNTAANLTATLSFSSGTGTFQTKNFTATGSTLVTINSITNASNQTATFTSGPSYTVPSGIVTFTKDGTTNYVSDQATASLAGSLLTIDGVKWSPLTTVDLYIDSYAHAPINVLFTPMTFNGSAHYGVASAGGTTAQIAAYGVITVTSVTPMLTGTFSFTDPDSSHITNGTFSVPTP